VSILTDREWVRVDNERASPSEVIVDSQSKTAAMVAEAVGYDAAKQIKAQTSPHG